MSPVRDIHPSPRTVSLCEESPPQCLNHWPGRKVIIPHRGGTNVPREVSPVNSIYVSKSPFGRKNAQGSLFARLVPCNSPGGPTTVLFCASEIVLRVRLARFQLHIFATTFPVDRWHIRPFNNGRHMPLRRPVHKLMHMSVRKSIHH